MSQFDVLRKIGLSKGAVDCYGRLLEHGPSTARQLAERMNRQQANLYNQLSELAEQGFASKTKMTTQPTLFIARPLNHALIAHYMHQRYLVLGLCRELNLSPPPLLPPVSPRYGIMKV
jgi:sugar-specific transcriptional regulator TrmB